MERQTAAKAFAKDVPVDQERKLGDRRRSDTVLVLTVNDADWGLENVSIIMTPSAPFREKARSQTAEGTPAVAPTSSLSRSITPSGRPSWTPPDYIHAGAVPPME